MTKNVWVQPQTVVQQFVANEYVAACGDMNQVYKFTCDAGRYWFPIIGTVPVPGTVFEDSNGNGQLDDSDRDLTSSWWPEYHACGVTHEAPKTDEFLTGFYKPLNSEYGMQKVIIWTEDGTNVHCTTNLDMSSWPTDKS